MSEPPPEPLSVLTDISLPVSLTSNQCYCSYCYSLTSSTVLLLTNCLNPLLYICGQLCQRTPETKDPAHFFSFTCTLSMFTPFCYILHLFCVQKCLILRLCQVPRAYFKTMLFHLLFQNRSIKTGWLDRRWRGRAREYKHTVLSLSCSFFRSTRVLIFKKLWMPPRKVAWFLLYYGIADGKWTMSYKRGVIFKRLPFQIFSKFEDFAWKTRILFFSYICIVVDLHY